MTIPNPHVYNGCMEDLVGIKLIVDDEVPDRRYLYNGSVLKANKKTMYNIVLAVSSGNRDSS